MATHEEVLTEVEPSPVEETPADLKNEYFPPQPKASSTNILGLSQHSTVYYLQRIQKYSSYVFSAYAAVCSPFTQSFNKH